MAYQVIARKWRPQSFQELVGQSHISQTLYNAIKNGRIHHALLFAGPRGTGKTSTARILAKSLRCPNAVDFVPCNQCASCQDIALGRSIDVIEIDGASNNGVDAIRDLREGVAFMPSSGTYKIYIIDEVHMLSTSAFNALLKTLEEPPAHVIFMMATTEAHKIPQTILSRCQRFDFRSISTRLIVDRLRHICTEENVQFEDEALWMIARQGDGSMRDSQSLLDQAITFTNGQLTVAAIVSILGLTDRALIIETLSSLMARDQQRVMKTLGDLVKTGADYDLFLEDLLEMIRNTLMIKLAGLQEQVDIAESEARFLQTLGQSVSEEDLHLLFDMTLKGLQDLKRASEPRFVFEMVLLRMVVAPRVQSLAALLSGAPMKEAPATAVATPTPTVMAAKPTAKSDVKSETPRKPVANMSSLDKWTQFILDIKTQDGLLGAQLEQLLFVKDADKVLEVSVPPKLAFLKEKLSEPQHRSRIQSFVESFYGAGFQLKVVMSSAAPTAQSASTVVQQKQKQEHDDLLKRVAEHPEVKRATSVINGQVKSIRSVTEKTKG